MQVEIKPYQQSVVRQAVAIWNEVVEEGIAFPQTELLE